MEAETLIPNDHTDEYGIPIKNSQVDEYGIPLKKKVSTPDLSSTIPSSSTGLNPFPLSQPGTDLTPVFPQNRGSVRERQVQVQKQQDLEDAQHEQGVIRSLKDGTFATALKNQQVKHAADIINQQVNPNSPEVQQKQADEAEEERNAYKGTIPLSDRVSAVTNNVYNGLGTMGKGLVRSAGTIAKAITPDAIVAPERYNASINKLMGYVDKGVDFAKQNTTTNHGQIDPKELEAINKNPVNGMINGLSEFAPAIASAERTGGLSFFMNDYEKGYENIDKASKDQNLNLSEGAKQAYAAVQGTASALLMTHNLHSLLGNAGEKTTQSVINKISLDAIDNLSKSGEDMTAANLKKATTVAMDNIEDKVKNYGIKALKGTATSIGDLSALEAAKIGADHLINTTTGKQVFNMDNQADRMQDAIKTGALFGVAGALGRTGLLLSKGTPERNNVIENIYKDPSQENLDQIKNTVQQHLEQKGVSQDAIDATNKTVDQIHEVAKSLPKSLPFEKQVKITDLILERKNLEKTQGDNASQNSQLDPVFAEQHDNHDVAYQDRIDSINDKIKSIASDTPVKYFKDEEGQPMKQFGDGEPEKISENRYYTEKPHLALTHDEQAEPTQEVPAKTPTDETIGEATPVNTTDETTENTPIKPTENESTDEKNGEESQKSSSQSKKGSSKNEESHEENGQNEVINSGEDQAEPDITKPIENDNKTTIGGNDNAGATETTPAEVQPKPSEEKGGEKAPEGKEVKKTILTKRAYEGEVADDVKKYLKDKGLTRSSFSQEERSKQATDFINKFGEEAAHHAVEAGDVEGGMAASILAQLQIRNSRAMAELPENSEEREALAKKQAGLISLMEKKGYLGGEFNGQLAHEYQNAELDYANVKKQVENLTGKPLTEAQEKKAKELTDENEKLKTQLQEAEAKLIEETDKAFNEGIESAKNETKAEKAKRIANKLRQNAKLHKPNVFSSANPASLVWDTAIEVVAKSIEAGGKLADAIDAGIEHIKKTDWYKSLPENKKIFAEKEFKRFNNDHSGSTDLADLQERFLDKKDNKFTPDEARDIWGYMKENYLNDGASYRDAVSKTAEDLGLSWRQVSEAVITPKLKRQSDEMWKRQSDYTRNRTSIKNWVGEQNKSAAGKALSKLSGAFRGVAVFGHGGIFMGTHAGMTLFNPSTWNKTIPAFFRGWKYAYGNEGAYQRSIEELKHSPNYLVAQRAGLKNNPERINSEEYQKSQHYLGKLGLAGERGFNAVKVLRQDLFDYHFNKLTPAERDDPAVAQSIAHLVNLATGATNLKLPAWVNEASFAGGMEAARWEKLTANPVKASQVALNALFNPSKASTADKVFAKVWARRVGEQLATYSALLLANNAIQKTLNPKNLVNYTNPNKPDYMKFKFGDVTIDPTSGMRGVAMFIRTLGKIPFESKKELHGDKRIGVAGKDIANYGRGKLAPLYSTAADFFGGTDFNGNVMPYSKDKPNKTAHKLTWPEYALSKAPLPIAEAVNVFYKSAQEHGAHKSTLDNVLRGIMSGAISGTTGFRVGEYDANAPENKKHK